MRVLGIGVLAAAASLATAACEKPPLPPANTAMPGWVRQQIVQGGEYPPIVLHVSYDGQPAYQTTATDRADSGDEHGLFSADGNLICRFGGWSPEVTSGACRVENIIYVNMLYEPEFAKQQGRQMPPAGTRIWKR